jgi:phosphoribosyl 1,2-cyclic phosphodiesterase
MLHGVGPAWPEICFNPHCPVCSGADRPLDGRGNTSLTIVGGPAENPAFTIGIDLGRGMWQGMRRAGLRLPDLQLVTHLHPDHVNHMEMDTLARALRAAPTPSPRLRLVTSRESWDMLPQNPRRAFDLVRIEPGQQLQVQVRSATATITAIDASDHFAGALAFVVEVSGFRLGALFDLKSWSKVDHAVVEALDLAVIAGNTLLPCAERTGHVSIAEDIAFLGTLRRPPRLSLLTHYGHDDPELHSQGSLVALLAGLAPHLAVRMAYKGMCVSSEVLPPRNPVAVLDPGTNLVVGAVEKSVAHTQGLLHASALLLARSGSGKLLVYERHQHQSYPGCLDVFGGHLQPSDGGEPRRAALREAAEELRVYTRDSFQVALSEQWLVQIGKSHELESDAPRNRERSTLFGIAVPPALAVRAFDEADDGTEVALGVQALTLDELLSRYRASPDRIADGLARILARVEADPEFRAEVLTFING